MPTSVGHEANDPGFHTAEDTADSSPMSRYTASSFLEEMDAVLCARGLSPGLGRYCAGLHRLGLLSEVHLPANLGHSISLFIGDIDLKPV